MYKLMLTMVVDRRPRHVEEVYYSVAAVNYAVRTAVMDERVTLIKIMNRDGAVLDMVYARGIRRDMKNGIPL